MVAAPGVVHLVVSAHDRPGLRLFDDPLKGAQVDFPQCTLIYFYIDRHALKFLIVAGIVFQRGADTFALDATYRSAAHFAR